jgi:hypothetical protein
MKNIDSFILSQLGEIPNVKEGKSDILTLSAYVFDIKNFQTFAWRLKQANEYGQKDIDTVIRKWKIFLDMRRSVNFEAYEKHGQIKKHDFI